MRRSLVLAAMFATSAVAFGLSATAQDFRQPAPATAKVYFIEPKNGAEVTGPVTVKFGLS